MKISTKDVFVQVNGSQQPEEAGTRKSLVISQISTPTTRSTQKRKVNGIYDDLCETPPLTTGKQEDLPTTSASLPEMTVTPETTPSKLTKIDVDVNMTTPTNNSRSATRGSRNSKLSEPFSPLALNSNLPPRDGRRSSMVHIREPLVPSDKNMREAAPGTTTTTQNGRTVTVTVNRPVPTSTTVVNSPPRPPVVAFPNDYNGQNKPCPLHESATLVPLLQPILSP
jgi:hypothetical protein